MTRAGMQGLEYHEGITMSTPAVHARRGCVFRRLVDGIDTRERGIACAVCGEHSRSAGLGSRRQSGTTMMSRAWEWKMPVMVSP